MTRPGVAQCAILMVAMCASVLRAGQVESDLMQVTSGAWTDPTQWSSNPYYPNNGNPAGTTYAVYAFATSPLTISSNITVDYAGLGGAIVQTQGRFSAIQALDIYGTYSLSGSSLPGATLANTYIRPSGTLQVTGGAFATIDGSKLSGSIELQPASHTQIVNGLTLSNGILNLNTSSTAGADPIVESVGDQTWTGSGIMHFSGTGGSTNGLLVSSGTLTLDFDVVENLSGSANIDASAGSLKINPSTSIQSRVANQSLTISGNWSAAGDLNCVAGLMYLNGNWSSTGTIEQQGGQIFFGGNFSSSSLARYRLTGFGSPYGTWINGTMDNTGAYTPLHGSAILAASQVLTGGGGTLGTTGGSVPLAPAVTPTIRGGTIWTAPYLGVVNGLLDGVSLDTDVMIGVNSSLTINNLQPLINGHGITLIAGSVLALPADTSFSGTGHLDLRGLGSVIQQAGGSLTIGPNVSVLGTGAGGTVGMAVGGSVINQGLISAQGSGTSVTIRGSSFTNNGTLQAVLGGSIIVSTSSFTNLGGGTLTGGTYNLTSGTLTLPSSITTNAANIVLSGSSAQLSALSSLANNTGSLSLLTGATLSISGNLANSGTLVVGGLQFPAGKKLTNSGSLSGTGTINANVENAGTIAPGSSPGLMTINGTLTLDPSSVLNMEIAGNSRGDAYDALIVNGPLALNGTLNVVFLNNYAPPLNWTFDLFDSTSVSGSFATVALPPLPSGETWNTSALAQGLITVTSIPEPALFLVLSLLLVLRPRKLGRFNSVDQRGEIFPPVP